MKLLSSFCQASVLFLCINSRVYLKICIFFIDIRKTMDSQYSGSLVGDDYSEENSMESHIPKTITALRQKSVMKTVLKTNKGASQLKTVLKRNSIPGLH